ncbi:hypothetical protein ACFL1X_02780 [Candidatus Hydrogenedentota bacterium]
MMQHLLPRLESFLVIAAQDSVWKPGIDEPTFLGWATVAAFALTAVMAFRVARAEHRKTDGPARRHIAWHSLFLLPVTLGINKHLDLQTWFTLVGKQTAKTQGWYVIRRTAQTAFIASLLVMGLTACAPCPCTM